MATKNYGVGDIMEWNFTPVDLPAEWLDHLGTLAEGARILVRGRAKNGKTTYVLRMAKSYAKHVGKVNFNSTEQGRTSGFKKSVMQVDLSEVAGKFVLCSRDQKDFEVWFKKLQGKNTGKVIVLDSMDYMGLTFDQFKRLNDRFPSKTIILVCWHDNKVAKSIEYMMDALVTVRDFTAHCISREGGGKPYVIREKKPVIGDQPSLFDIK